MSRVLVRLGLSRESFARLSPKLRQRVVELLLRWQYEEDAIPLVEMMVQADPNGLLHRSHLVGCLAACGRFEEAQSA
ncbi:MAG TPA: hypothetical protein VHS06_08140, partial [Chloroflexota bacterium]|nr:hypothetical protein [Chloroflexota bacterium]